MFSFDENTFSKHGCFQKIMWEGILRVHCKTLNTIIFCGMIEIKLFVTVSKKILFLF